MARLSPAVALAAFTIACGGGTALRMPERPPSPEQMAELWAEPAAPRDLFYSVGGKRFAPPPDATYTFVDKDELGFSVSYDVKSPDGIEWSAKIGPEAQTEVVVSRILWGAGYHQPPTYYLPSWDVRLDTGEVKKESEARFRPKLSALERRDEFWRWQDNPFLGTRPVKGLLVILLMLNSTDLKDDNNSIYELKERWSPEILARRWYVVRDIGASLGETGKLFPRRNWIEGFEKEGFIKGVKDGRIEFAFTGRHKHLLEMITPADLRWAADRLERLTNEQWRDAFRAGNYTDGTTDRYLRKIRQKIEEAKRVAATAATDAAAR